MNKQEATEFILQALANHQTTSEIADQLSGELKAPREVVEQFVLRVSAQQAAANPPAPEAAAVPAEEARVSEASVVPAVESPAPAAANVPIAEEPPALEAEVVTAVDEPLQADSAQGEEETSYPPLPVAHTPKVEPDSQTWENEEVQGNDLLDDKELVKVVLRRLNKGDNRNDIITMVCERSNTSWPQAQRLVSQVEVDNYQGLSLKRKLPLLLGSIGISVLGVLLMLFGVLAAGSYLAELTGQSSGVPQNLLNPAIGPDGALVLAIAGAGMAAGGGVGIFRALQDHL